jgi:hypothetical protein
MFVYLFEGMGILPKSENVCVHVSENRVIVNKIIFFSSLGINNSTWLIIVSYNN